MRHYLVSLILGYV